MRLKYSRRATHTSVSRVLGGGARVCPARVCPALRGSAAEARSRAPAWGSSSAEGYGSSQPDGGNFASRSEVSWSRRERAPVREGTKRRTSRLGLLSREPVGLPESVLSRRDVTGSCRLLRLAA